ncbi:MAG: hypothetical protein U1F65_00915 [Verrucomicrobiota bacterium]
MVGIRRQAHRFEAHHLGFLFLAHLPQRGEGAGGAFLRGIELHPDPERLVAEKFRNQPEVNLPLALITRRHHLIGRLHLLDNLPADFREVGAADRVLLETFPQHFVGVALNVLVRVFFPHRTAGDEHFAPENQLLRRRQFCGAPLEQDVNAQSGQAQQGGVERQDAEPFAQPDLPAGDGFHRHHLHLTFLDVAGQRAAGQPQRGQSQQRRDGGQRVGQENLGEPARRAVILDQHRQRHHRREQQHGHDQKEPEAKGRFPGQSDDGKELLH